MNPAGLRAKIEGAKGRLLTAEKQMEAALQKLGSAQGVEKSMISGPLETAFAELKAARQDLTDLEQAIATET